MGRRKNILSLVLLAWIVFTFAACSGSKKVCPAYSSTGKIITTQNAG